MKTVYPDENNVVLNETVLKERKPGKNIESKSNEFTTKLNSRHNINIKVLVFVTPPSIYQNPVVIFGFLCRFLEALGNCTSPQS